MARADGVLVVSLAHKWFDMIASGEKLEEYRGRNWANKLIADPDYWCDNLSVLMQGNEKDFHPYHTLRAQRAYSGVWLERKICRIRWGKPRPEWSGKTVTGDCFIIELEPTRGRG